MAPALVKEPIYYQLHQALRQVIHEEALSPGGKFLTERVIAERFGVSRAWIGKMLKQRRQTGSLAPLPHGGGQAAKYAGRNLEQLRAEVIKQPDATLEELRQRTGSRGSIMAVFRALKGLKSRLKKSPSGRRSRIVPT